MAKGQHRQRKGQKNPYSSRAEFDRLANTLTHPRVGHQSIQDLLTERGYSCHAKRPNPNDRPILPQVVSTPTPANNGAVVTPMPTPTVAKQRCGKVHIETTSAASAAANTEMNLMASFDSKANIGNVIRSTVNNIPNIFGFATLVLFGMLVAFSGLITDTTNALATATAPTFLGWLLGGLFTASAIMTFAGKQTSNSWKTAIAGLSIAALVGGITYVMTGQVDSVTQKVLVLLMFAGIVLVAQYYASVVSTWSQANKVAKTITYLCAFAIMALLGYDLGTAVAGEVGFAEMPKTIALFGIVVAFAFGSGILTFLNSVFGDWVGNLQAKIAA